MKKVFAKNRKLYSLFTACLFLLLSTVMPLKGLTQNVVSNSAGYPGMPNVTVPHSSTPANCVEAVGGINLKTPAVMDALRLAIKKHLTTEKTVRLDLYVMSQCPFGVMAERSIIPVIKDFGNNVEFRLNFIANETGSGNEMVFTSLHGQPEINENIRQLIIAQNFPDKLYAYLLARAENYREDNWQVVANRVGINADELASLVSRSNNRVLFNENIQHAITAGITASPTLFIDGIHFDGDIIDGSSFASQCQSGTDPFSNKNWVVCSTTPTSAWVTSTSPNGGQYHSLYICQSLGYSSVGRFGGTCGAVCGYCNFNFSCNNPQTNPTFDGGGTSCGSDSHGPILCNTVMWECLGPVTTCTPQVSCPGNVTIPNDPGQCSGTWHPATTLVAQYNPTGPHSQDVPITPTNVAPGYSAGNLSAVGYPTPWGNTNVWPVGQITSSPTILTSEYITFSITVPNGTDLARVQYSKRSYLGNGASKASIRSSLDGFASDIASINVSSGGDQELVFDVSNMPFVSGAVTFRIYFYGSPADRTDWDDLVSTFFGANGLRVYANNLATVTNECSPDSWTYTNLPADYKFPKGTTTVTATATKGSNSGSCTFTVTVNDTELPTITCPGNIIVPFDPSICTGAKVCYPGPVASDNCPPATPSGYTFKTQIGNHYYYQSNATSNYATAAANAAAAGGHLAVITTAAENSALNASGAGFAWLGGNDTENDGVFKWSDCEPFSYSNFCGGEPNGGTFENYLEFESGGCWNDLNENALRYSILEVEGARTVQTAGLPTNSVFPIGTTTNTFVVTDAAGNTATCSFDVTVTPDPCFTCSTTITVDQNTMIDFNTPTPTYSGDPDLAPYFSWNKSDPDPSKWKAIFNIGSHGLNITNNATITTVNVPNSSNNQKAPGIEINSTCTLSMDAGTHIIVNSLNQNSGDITLNFNGNVTINGEIRNEVSATQGLPGAITIKTQCGDINVGVTGQVYDIGTGPGGNMITLQSCGTTCHHGDINVDGLVKAYSNGSTAANKPAIKVISGAGTVHINGNTVEPLYDEFLNSGTRYDIWGGLLAWVRDNSEPGYVNVQAWGDVVANGHGDDPTAPVRKSFGAIAAVSTSSNAPGGSVDVRSLNAGIYGNNRAFDVSGRNRMTINYAHINLAALHDIILSRPGNSTNNPVVDASSPSVGDRGGRNDLQSYVGRIIIGSGTMISAAVPTGTGSIQGGNFLVSCGGVVNGGTVSPADGVPGDDAGVCGGSPTPLYSPCTPIIINNDRMAQNITAVIPVRDVQLMAYPNPFNNTTTIRYTLSDQENVQLKIFGVNGEVITTLVSGQQGKGDHQLQWNPAGLLSGVYFVQLKTGDKVILTKLVLQR